MGDKKVQGEGDYESARRYRKETERSVLPRVATGWRPRHARVHQFARGRRRPLRQKLGELLVRPLESQL